MGMLPSGYGDYRTDFCFGICCICLCSSIFGSSLGLLKKAPTTLFVIPAVVPLIPGSTIYYTMNAVVNANTDGFSHYGSLTVQYALSIAAGISVVWTIWSIFRKYRLKTTEENRI